MFHSDSQSDLTAEADGSLFVDALSDRQLPINFTCTVYNELGTDQVVYQLYKEKCNYFFFSFCAQFKINFLFVCDRQLDGKRN